MIKDLWCICILKGGELDGLFIITLCYLKFGIGIVWFCLFEDKSRVVD